MASRLLRLEENADLVDIILRPKEGALLSCRPIGNRDAARGCCREPLTEGGTAEGLSLALRVLRPKVGRDLVPPLTKASFRERKDVFTAAFLS